MITQFYSLENKRISLSINTGVINMKMTLANVFLS